MISQSDVHLYLKRLLKMMHVFYQSHSGDCAFLQCQVEDFHGSWSERNMVEQVGLLHTSVSELT